jgi:hypothetical protein
MILMALRMRTILKMRSTLMTLRILPSLVESLIATFKLLFFMHCCGSKGKRSYDRERRSALTVNNYNGQRRFTLLRRTTCRESSKGSITDRHNLSVKFHETNPLKLSVCQFAKR